MLNDSAGPAADLATLIRTAVGRWRDGLVTRTGSNWLLNLKASRTGAVSLIRPSPDEVLLGLTAGRVYRFRSLKPKRDGDEFVEGTRQAAKDGEEAPNPLPAVDLLDSDKSTTSSLCCARAARDQRSNYASSEKLDARR